MTWRRFWRGVWIAALAGAVAAIIVYYTGPRADEPPPLAAGQTLTCVTYDAAGKPVRVVTATIATWPTPPRVPEQVVCYAG